MKKRSKIILAMLGVFIVIFLGMRFYAGNMLYNPTLKIILAILGVFAVIFLGVGFYAGNILYNLALNPESDRSRVFGSFENDDNNQVEETEVPGMEGYKKAEWLK